MGQVLLCARPGDARESSLCARARRAIRGKLALDVYVIGSQKFSPNFLANPKISPCITDSRGCCLAIKLILWRPPMANPLYTLKSSHGVQLQERQLLGNTPAQIIARGYIVKSKRTPEVKTFDNLPAAEAYYAEEVARCGG